MATILMSAQCPTSYQTSGVYWVKLVSAMLFVTIMGCVKISIKLHTNIRKILLEEKTHTIFLNADDILLYWQIQNAPYNPRWQKHNTLRENLQESPKTRQKVYFFLDSAALRYLRIGNIKWWRKVCNTPGFSCSGKPGQREQRILIKSVRAGKWGLCKLMLQPHNRLCVCEWYKSSTQLESLKLGCWGPIHCTQWGAGAASTSSGYGIYIRKVQVEDIAFQTWHHLEIDTVGFDQTAHNVCRLFGEKVNVNFLIQKNMHLCILYI